MATRRGSSVGFSFSFSLFSFFRLHLIHNDSWIYNNLWRKWSSTVRRHLATKSTAVQTLSLQLSGYGAKQSLVQAVLDSLDVKEPSDLETWEPEKIHKFVDTFLEHRFSTILVLNKVDHPDSDHNIRRVYAKYPETRIVPSCALAEIFLRKLAKQKYIRYIEGEENFDTLEDLTDGSNSLLALDPKNKARLEKIRDMVLLRYGSTGVQEAIKRAVDIRGLIPVYTVKNLNTFSCSNRAERVFQDCSLVYPNTTVGDLAKMLHPDIHKYFLYAENALKMRLSENDVITFENNIIKFTTAVREKEK
eukprot:TRINITY_DN1622_c0_g1_i6.p1 TRINITY_DN1622_c0_g1~~TRINITY_DN1622_c0_g1_i6.p1  ORF type:complete len:304 (-),score=54.85 TRINITY_DN1622_c0_g1_i6:19-930(-)